VFLLFVFWRLQYGGLLPSIKRGLVLRKAEGCCLPKRGVLLGRSFSYTTFFLNNHTVGLNYKHKAERLRNRMEL